ncbi:hypothetical protein [Candidatus Soleaferrea massiliensis]|uniref:hypothetical protein n=1 Tax=Candidatus Soleaferrea massiliensis TaxID=1470354 RepID=UPI00058B4F5A|nr:hypothetical protein [Candidatus Soleaferrea massiliensis]
MKKRALLCILTAGMLLLAGCGDSSDASQTSSEPSSAASSQQSEPVSSAASEQTAIQPVKQSKFEQIGDWTAEQALQVGFYGAQSLQDNTLVFQVQQGMELELIVIDPSNGQELADEDFDTAFISVYGNNIAVREEGKVRLVNARLEELKSVDVPSEMNLWSYNISSDLGKLSFADEEGINIYDLATGKEKQLDKHPNPNAAKYIDNELYKGSFFVDSDKQLLVRNVRYEDARGYTLFNLNNNRQTFINMPQARGEQEFIMQNRVCVVHPLENGSSVVNVCDYLDPERVLTYEMTGLKEGGKAAMNEEYAYYFAGTKLYQMDLSDGTTREVEIKYQLESPTMMGVTTDNTILYADGGVWYSCKLG